LIDEYLLCDTNVVQYLTRNSPQSVAYQGLIGERRLAISFQTEAELLGFPYKEARRRRLEDLLAAMLKLPHSEATSVWYGRVVEARKNLRTSHRPGEGASEADVWIIASALEHQLPLLTHDEHQVHLGRAMGLRVLTNLPDLREANPHL
jgi:predicted nucleic acid-binding protein